MNTVRRKNGALSAERWAVEQDIAVNFVSAKEAKRRRVKRNPKKWVGISDTGAEEKNWVDAARISAVSLPDAYQRANWGPRKTE